jgi:hypothetical protein
MGVAIFMMAASANAGTISYTTNSAGTEFVLGINSLTLDSISGQSGTLTFEPNGNSASGVPSNIDLGDFIMACPTCTTNQSTIFGAFTFDLIVDDTTNGATGEFVGTSTGGTVSINSSTVEINWQAPYQLGPGGNAAMTGNFGTTYFDIVTATSLIVAPNSGSNPGDTTIQAQVNATPEPATLIMTGGALLGLGLFRRRTFPRK